MCSVRVTTSAGLEVWYAFDNGMLLIMDELVQALSAKRGTEHVK